MFTAEQLAQIRDWAKSLNVYNDIRKILGERKIVSQPTRKLHLDDNERMDDGFDLAILIAILEYLIPACLQESQQASDKISNKLVCNQKNFTSFLKVLIVELVKVSQSIGALENSIKNKAELNEEAQNITAWRKSINQLYNQLLQFIEFKNQVNESLVTSYFRSMKEFKSCTDKLKLVCEKWDNISKMIFDNSQAICIQAFSDLGLRKETSLRVNTSSKAAAASSPAASTVSGPASSEETVQGASNVYTLRKLNTEKLQKSYSALQYQQFVLTGHQVLNACAKYHKYTAQNQKYAEGLSAVLFSQQMVVSDRYLDLLAKKSLEDVEDAITVLASRTIAEHTPSQTQNMLSDLGELVGKAIKSVAHSGQINTNIENIGENLCKAVTEELELAAPNISNLLVSMAQRGDTRLVNELTTLVNKKFSDVFPTLPEAFRKLSPEDKVTAELSKMLPTQWLKALKATSGSNPLDGIINLVATDVLDFGDSQFVKDAATVIGNLIEGDASNIWKHIAGGLGGGALDSLGGPVIGAAIDQFLPVVTREIFGDGDFANVASSAIGGAISGFTVGGPIGALVGAGLSLLPSLFGGGESKAEREQKEQAQFDKMKGMMVSISNDIKSYTGACFEQLDKRVMTRFDDVQRQLTHISNDLHKHMDQLGLQMDVGFEAVLESIDGLSRIIDVRSKEVHAHINDLARHADYRFDRLEGIVYQVGGFLHQGIISLRDLQNTRFDRLEMILQREFNSLNRNIEFQFAQQKELLLRLHREQQQSNINVMSALGVIKDAIDFQIRLINKYGNIQQQNLLAVIERIDRQTYLDFRTKRTQALRSDARLDNNNPKKPLLKLVEYGVRGKIENSDLILWGEATQAYLYLLYQCPELWEDEDIQRATQGLIDEGMNFQVSLHQLPSMLSAQLVSYQAIFYDLYQEICAHHIKNLESQVKTKKAEDGTSLVATVAEQFKKWDSYKDKNNEYAEQQYNLSAYHASLNAGRTIAGTTLFDVLVKDDNTIWFYAKEHNNIVIRRFDLGKVIDKVVDAGKSEDLLLSYPVMCADYREVSKIDDVARTKEKASYVEFYARWKSVPSQNLLSCSSHGYAIRYIDGTLGRQLLLWHPIHGTKGITLPNNIGKISACNVLVRRDKVVVLFVNTEKQVWIGQCDSSANSLTCEHYPQLLNLVNPKNPHLLQAWGGWYVIANQYLLDVSTLQLKPFAAAETFSRYDSDTSRVRLYQSQPNKEIRGVYFDYNEQRFMPASAPYNEITSSSDHQHWIFNDRKLSLIWPFNKLALEDVSLSSGEGLQTYIGQHNNFTIYCSLGFGRVLLIKEDNDAHNLRNKILAETTRKIWSDEKSNIAKEYITPLVGEQREDAIHSNLIRKLNALVNSGSANQSKLQKFENDTRLLLRVGTKLKAEQELFLSLIIGGIKYFQGTEPQVFGSLMGKDQDNNTMRWMHGIMRGCYGLQQYFASLQHMTEAEWSYPILSNTLAALQRMSSLQNNKPDKIKFKPINRQIAEDKQLIELYTHLIGLGIVPNIKLHAQETGIVLEIKIFGKTWTEFCLHDRLFMERFRDEGQHERAIRQFLDVCHVWLCKKGYRLDQQGRLSEQFFENPSNRLSLCHGDNNIKKVFESLSRLMNITVKRLSTASTTRLSYLFVPFELHEAGSPDEQQPSECAQQVM